MGLYRTEAVVLGHKKLGEADKILTLFSLKRQDLMPLPEGFAVLETI